jgi:uncharacterized delta-60 repeat protein
MKRKSGSGHGGLAALAGDRDQSFGDGGVLIVHIPGYDTAYGRCVFMRDDYSLLLGSSVESAVLTNEGPDTKFTVTFLNAAAGEIDQGLGYTGHVSGNFSAARSIPKGFCDLGGGRFLMYGASTWTANQPLRSKALASFAVFNEDGKPDRHWGIDGTRAVDLQGWVMERAWPFALPDGILRVIGAGYDDIYAGAGLIVHLKADGWLDTTVNGTGVIPFAFPGGYDGAMLNGLNDCVADSDGRFVVAGNVSMRGIVMKIDDKGGPVESFGDKGRVFLDPPDPNVDVTTIEKVVALGDGKVMCVGTESLASAGYSGMVAVLTAEGRHDPGFNGGRALILTEVPRCRLSHAAADVFGRYILVGRASSTRDLIVVCVLASGQLDVSFGEGKGYVLDNLGGGQDINMVGGMTLDSEARIVVCGWTMTTGGSDVSPFVVRYLGKPISSRS